MKRLTITKNQLSIVYNELVTINSTLHTSGSWGNNDLNVGFDTFSMSIKLDTFMSLFQTNEQSMDKSRHHACIKT